MTKEKKVNHKTLSYEEYNERVKNVKTLSDLTSFFKDLLAPTIQSLLEAEMDNHLGYSKHDPAGNLSGNSRNGYYDKNIKTAVSDTVKISIPRDRNSTFDPIVVRKYETIESDIEERIVSMYAKGMSTRDIHSHMQEIYGVDMSADMVSSITDKVIPLVKEWQNRPLSSIFSIIYLDAIHFKVRDNGKIIVKAAYVILGINAEGMKEILGIWIGENESARYWLGILNEIKNRGVSDILITCIDGLTGFSEAIHEVFPGTDIQRCIVHQIRNTVKYVNYKDRKELCNDLKTIYTAPTAEAGLLALEQVRKKWPKYDIYLKSWETNWNELSTFFSYPEEIKKIIYTTNAIEGLNRQFRKITKTTSVFPHNESLAKLLWLVQKDITKKWTKPIPNWGSALGQFAIMFPGRIPLN